MHENGVFLITVKYPLPVACPGFLGPHNTCLEVAGLSVNIALKKTKNTCLEVACLNVNIALKKPKLIAHSISNFNALKVVTTVKEFQRYQDTVAP